MGFKKENYTLKGICVCVYFLMLSNLHPIIGQSQCPIRVEYEPRELTQNQSANIIEEVKFPFFQQWEDLDKLRLSDDDRASVTLPNVKRSTLFKGKNLGFSIPNGAIISGIELIVEGHSSGEGYVEDQMVRLLNSEGEAIGKNRAKQAIPTDKDWKNSTDNTDFIWRYGAPDDSWGILMSEELINNQQFGYALQVRNKLNAPITVSIDHIEMIVYYTPLYEICSNHACVPFYVDKTEDPLITYEWFIPEGFELISTSEETYAINIGASYADYGEYEICVESFYDESSQEVCCRKFNFTNCEPALISGKVFFDQNNNFTSDPNDIRLHEVLINLYTNQGTFVSSTFTNQNGDYIFDNLFPGQYYIEVVNDIDSLIFSTPNIGNDSDDSDITGVFGEGTSDIINLISGDSLTTLDAGLNLGLNLGDFVWEDLNGDGVQQIEEPGIEGVLVNITSSQSISYNIKTDENGYYSFLGLQPGEYSIDFTSLDGYIPTIPNIGDSQSDSDVVSGNSILLSYHEGGTIDSIDAGFFRPSSIGDFVWQDLNNNGIQEDSEPGISNVTLNLFDFNDVLVHTTTSDSLGFYSFENVAPGTYFIEIQPEIRFIPTLFDNGVDILNELNSDVYIQDDRFISASFTIISNSSITAIDFGFIEKPATLGGFTFLDQNNNGQYDSDESFVPEINVFLFDENNEKIDSTQSDLGGFYLFENVTAGSYYLVFELKENYLFTGPDFGNDLSDSDITNSLASGSTDLFTLLPEEENYSFAAGYQKKPKVGDFVWLDENANGIQDSDEIGINEVLVELYSDQDELIQSVLTGLNPESGEPGYYLFSTLDPGNYYIKIPVNESYDFAFVNASAIGMNSSITNANGIGTSNTFNLIGNQSNLDIDAGYAFKKGGIKGEVWIDQNDDGEQEITDLLKEGVSVSLYLENGTLLFTRNTDENGQYQFLGLDAGVYYVVFEITDQYRFTSPFAGSDPSLDSDVIGENIIGSTSMLTVMDGVIIEDIDAGLTDGSVTLRGITWIDNNGDGIFQLDELPLANVSVELYDLNDSLLATTTTFTTGEYQFFDNAAGDYYIVFTPPTEDYNSTLENIGADDNSDSDVTSFFTIGSTDTIEVVYFQEEAFINAGYFEFSSIGDQVFIDSNENGINDNEPGLDNVVVNLLNSSGEIINSDVTSQGGGIDSGYYLLENIPPGTYTVQFVRPLFYQFIPADQGMDDALDSDVADITNNTGVTKEITIFSGTTNTSIDAGVIFQIPTESSITGLIWDDANANGIRDNDELPISAIQMQLENQNGEVLEITISDMNGIYLFDNLSEGFYAISSVIPSDKASTIPNVGIDDNIDSDFFNTSDKTQTESFFLATFEDLANVDLGLVNKLNIGDFVWEDANNNGVQDQNELGIEEVEITITSEDGNLSERVMSNAEGAYEFIGLPAGRYKICVDLLSGFNFAKSNIGADILDSDVDSTGCTSIIDFTSGGTFNDLDIGLTKNGSIVGVAFVDLNGNGINNLGDPGLDGVPVHLYNAGGELIESTETSTLNDIEGVYEFANLKATDYYLVFEYDAEYIISNPDIGDDLTDSDITGTFGVGSTDIFAVPSGGIVINISGGAYLPASIGDEVWLDEDEDGIRDDEESGVPNIQVIIFRSFGIPFDTTYTDEEGLYQFENLKQGLYFIQFMIPQEFAISPSDEGLNDDIDSDADNTGKTPLISLAHGADLESVDCGIFSSMASLRSVVWNDSNGDGLRQKQEARIPGIRISLIDSNNEVVNSTQSNSLGLYAFQEIPEGKYYVYVDLEDSDYAFTSMNIDDNDYFDNDIKSSGESEVFTSDEMLSTLSIPNVDVGLYESGGIISIVWEDQNADGIYNLNEVPFGSIEASLHSKDGTLIKRKNSSDSAENLHFNNIAPGEYFISYSIDQAYVASPNNLDILDDNNSDVSKFEGMFITPTFQVNANEIVSHIDAGFYKGSIVKTTVWYDTNSNGMQDDAGDIPQGIYATLYDANGKSNGTRGINEEGEINFKGISKGAYYIKYYALKELNFTKSVDEKSINSDVDHSYGIGTTQLFDFDPYEIYTEIDAGLLKIAMTPHEIASSLSSTSPTYENRNAKEKELEELFFEVHPNPAANYLKINVDRSQSAGIISIRNSQNQLIFKENVENIDRVDLSNYHPGIFYVTYEFEGKSVVKRILKIQ